MTNRRRFLATLTGGLLAAPLVGLAQQPAKVPRIGVISERYSGDPMVEAFRQELRDLGYVEGQNVVIEYRYLHGVLDRVPAFARELIRIPVDVLVVSGTISTNLAKAEPATIPIVFILAGDPVGSGLVASLARPGGNVTGCPTCNRNSARNNSNCSRRSRRGSCAWRSCTTPSVCRPR